MKKPLRDWLIGTTILAALLIWVHLEIGWARLLSPWSQISMTDLVMLLALSLLSYIFRGIRLYDYFPELLRGHLPATIRLSILHNFANNLLPMRTGEAVFPLLMKRYFGHGYGASSFSLLWIRLLDLHVIGLLALLAAWLALPHWGWLVSGLFFISLIPVSHGLGPVLMHRLTGDQGKIKGLVRQALAAIPESGSQLFRVYLWTLLCWASKFLAFAAVLLHFIDVDLWQAITGIIGAELSSVLPFHGVAGTGSYELAMMAAMVPTGVDADAALQAAVNLHLFLLGVTLILGPLALLLPRPAVSGLD